jgi:Antitoxin ParD
MTNINGIGGLISTSSAEHPKVGKDAVVVDTSTISRRIFPAGHKPTFVLFLFTSERDNMSRLTIDVTDQQHQSLKALAALQGKTIKAYTIERLFPAKMDEEQAFESLKTLLAQRLAEADRGEIETDSVMEIARSELLRSAEG